VKNLQFELLHQVGQEWQNSEVAGTFYGRRNAALVFEAVASNTTWQQFALLIDELKQKICVFVVNVFDAELAEAAVFFAAQPDAWVTKKFYIFS
jgi:hypothetical protein